MVQHMWVLQPLLGEAGLASRQAGAAREGVGSASMSRMLSKQGRP